MWLPGLGEPEHMPHRIPEAVWSFGRPRGIIVVLFNCGRKAMLRITILGPGMMGTAITFPLSDRGHEVRLVGTHLDTDIIDMVCHDAPIRIPWGRQFAGGTEVPVGSGNGDRDA